MLIFSELVNGAAGNIAAGVNATAVAPIGELRLNFEWRQKSRFRAALSSGPRAGDDVGVRLDRGHVLHDGALLRSADGSTVRIRAAVESLLHVTAADELGLARIAYHLGNRHVPVQVGKDQAGLWLRLQLDHVLENMVTGLDGRVQVVTEPFDPESGAYGHGHAHASESSSDAIAGKHDDRGHAPKIHDFL
jgi:urease accessory protein